jgi:hypothetical protein
MSPNGVLDVSRPNTGEGGCRRHRICMSQPDRNMFYTRFRSTSCRAMMIFCISLVPSPMHRRGASR